MCIRDRIHTDSFLFHCKHSELFDQSVNSGINPCLLYTSIQNQKMYLEEYARQKGLRNIRHLSDDGYSGTNFKRPGFTALLEEIEAGRVAVSYTHLDWKAEKEAI